MTPLVLFASTKSIFPIWIFILIEKRFIWSSKFVREDYMILIHIKKMLGVERITWDARELWVPVLSWEHLAGSSPCPLSAPPGTWTVPQPALVFPRLAELMTSVALPGNSPTQTFYGKRREVKGGNTKDPDKSWVFFWKYCHIDCKLYDSSILNFPERDELSALKIVPQIYMKQG